MEAVVSAGGVTGSADAMRDEVGVGDLVSR